ncbi:MAG: DNA primase [Pseudomonadota bacterium]|nr:DNA primase [Pseudomonadota bacterium]
MAFPKHFIDELRARTDLVSIVGQRVALKKRGRDHWGCCPFHNEKSASFKVSEDRDDYHCFGCGAHGTAFDFVMQTESLSFPEAVERLAEAAGMQVPQVAPQEREKADRLSRLAEANEAATKWFQSQLHGAAGAAARDYLGRRGLGEQAIAEFRLGFAPDRNDALKAALLDRGFREDELVEAGLIARPDDGRPSYDRFRNRLMFPIGDRRGRVIAFGGRALGEARAKYLNSPDTPLFDKGHSLYNHAMAREAAREAGTVVVVEGYMDAIALAEAGIRNVVAPLGTALTENQIEMLWRMTAEPVICLDGDAAGLRAAHRAAERALSILKPGRSLRFALMPEGLDPDDLVRQRGPAAAREALARTTSSTEMLWQGLVEGRPLDTPERKAALEADIDRLLTQVTDETVRVHYRNDLRARMFDAVRATRPARPLPGRPGRPGFRREAPESVAALKSIQANSPLRTREEAILAALLRWPELAVRYEHELDDLHLVHDDLDHCLLAIRDAVSREPGLDSDGLARHLDATGLDRLVVRLRAPNATKLDWKSLKDPPLEMVGEQFDATLRRYRVEVLQAEYDDAWAAARRELTAEAFERMAALKRALDRAKAEEPVVTRASLGGEA